MQISRCAPSLKTLFIAVVMFGFQLSISSVYAGADVEPIKFWGTSNEKNTNLIDHSKWQAILDKYLISDHPSGINRFDYRGVNSAYKTRLDDYLTQMQTLDPRTYPRATQKAYWINLYNALTVKLILDNYPVSSITKISDSIFSFGPWDDQAATIQGQALTLNDIEHGILRAFWKDNRIHYAVNCASISCPNLSAKAFTVGNSEQLLEQLAKDYVNHQRGVQFEDGKLVVSSIYHWYKIDFGNNDASLLLHLQRYAKSPLKEKLSGYKDDIEHDYDWKLNQP